MEETISRMAGSEKGSFKPISELEEIAARAGRPAKQRTTLYGEVPPERLEAARKTDGIGHFGRPTLTLTPR
jgi:FO synthase